MEKDTKIIEMMPDDVSDKIISAIAEGRLCRYAQELEGDIERLNADIDKIGTEKDPFWVTSCEMKSKLAVANARIVEDSVIIDNLYLEINRLRECFKNSSEAQ